MMDFPKVPLDKLSDDEFVELVNDVCEIIQLSMVYNRTHNNNNEELAIFDYLVYLAYLAMELKKGFEGSADVH